MYEMIIKLAWKNSFYRLSRTFLLIVMIAVSMSMMLWLQGLYDGMAENMIDKNKRAYSGDLSIFAKGYLVDKEIKENIASAELIKELEASKGVKALVSRVETQGLLATARKSAFVTLVGIDPKQESRFGEFEKFLKKGSYSLENNSALIGIELAKKLKVKEGSKVVFSSQDIHGEIVSIAYKIAGIVQTTNIVYDSRAIFVQKTKIQKVLGLKADEVMQIAIMSDDQKLIEALKKRYTNYDLKTFVELQPIMKQMQDMTVIFNSITFAVVMGVVFIGIFGVVYVSVLERLREFGIMLSLGYHYKYIKIQITLEALFVALVGYLFGAIFGALILYYMQVYGLDFSDFSDALEMWGYESVIYATMKLHYFIYTFLAIVLASLLSVIIPLRKIKKMDPVDVIKVEK